jgi:hypothetical protein
MQIPVLSVVVVGFSVVVGVDMVKVVDAVELCLIPLSCSTHAFAV